MVTKLTLPAISLIDMTDIEITKVYNNIFSKNENIMKYFGNPTLDDYLNAQNKICFKIKLKNITVGYIVCNEDSSNPKNACIWSLYIYPEYRHKGYGSLALNMVIDFLKYKYDYVYGFCNIDNTFISYYIKRYRFLKKNCYDIGCINNDLSNLHEFVRHGDDFEIIFHYKFK